MHFVTVMQNNLETIDHDQLLCIVGGQQTPNQQNDTIGVSVGDATVGMTKNGSRSDYALCLQAGVDGKWTPDQIAATCGLPPAARPADSGASGGGGGGFR